MEAAVPIKLTKSYSRSDVPSKVDIVVALSGHNRQPKCKVTPYDRDADKFEIFCGYTMSDFIDMVEIHKCRDVQLWKTFQKVLIGPGCVT